MKQFSLSRLLTVLRAFIVILVITLVTHVLFSFTVNKYTDDLWKQLGISQREGTESIKTSFFNNYFQYYGATKAKHIVTGNRAAVTKDLLAYCKKYVNSHEFKTAYDQLRTDAKPAGPEKTTVRTKEEIRKDKIRETEEAMKKMETSMKDMTADVQKMMKPTMDFYEQQLKDYKDPKNKMIDMFVMAEKYEVESQQRSYDERYKRWEKEYPVEAKDMIKQRLQQYLDLSETVDFNAVLVEKNRRKVFSKATYEAKPSDWKMIFRAGKEVNDVARPFVQQWINELK